MANGATEMTRFNEVTTTVHDDEWRYGEQLSGTVSVMLDLTVIEKAAKAKQDTYLTGVSKTSPTVTVKGGLPLAKITSGTSKGNFGPYDPDATDGRADAVWGLLESDVIETRTFEGFEHTALEVGMRFRGNVIVSKLPVVPADGTPWYGDFVSVDTETGECKRLTDAKPTTSGSTVSNG